MYMMSMSRFSTDEAGTRQTCVPFTAAFFSGASTELPHQAGCLRLLPSSVYRQERGREGRFVSVTQGIGSMGAGKGMQEGCEVPAVEDDGQGTPGARWRFEQVDDEGLGL
jgi:hypothetical protein